MKICPRCKIDHQKQGIFCSRSCANSRQHSKVHRQYLSAKVKQTISKLSSDVKYERRQKISNTVKLLHKEGRYKHTYKHSSPRITLTCLFCKEPFVVIPFYKHRKFCNNICKNKGLNLIKYAHSKSVNRSKAEIYLAKALAENLQTQTLLNNRQILEGLELDIFFPQLNIAVEYNGPWHHLPLRGFAILEHIQRKDEKKKLLCFQKGIQLIVVNDETTSLKGLKSLIPIIVQDIQVGKAQTYNIKNGVRHR